MTAENYYRKIIKKNYEDLEMKELIELPFAAIILFASM